MVGKSKAAGMSQHVGMHGHRELGLLAVFSQGEVDCRAVQALLGADWPAPAGTQAKLLPQRRHGGFLVAADGRHANASSLAMLRSDRLSSTRRLRIAASSRGFRRGVNLQRKLRWINFRCRLTQGAAAAASCPAGLRSGIGLCAALHQRAASHFSSVP